MLAEAVPLDEYCPSCGEWVSYLHFNHQEGWCNECSGSVGDQLQCSRCGTALPEGHRRSTCHTCRQEQWYEVYGDDVEWFMVVKGYSLARAKATVIAMVRPICVACRKPIKGGREGDLFHKSNDLSKCHRSYTRYKRLRRQGMTRTEALDHIRSM